MLSNLYIWLILTVVLILNQRNGVNFFIFSCDSFTTTTFRCYWAASSVILWDIFTLMFWAKIVGVTLEVQCSNVWTFWPWWMNFKQTSSGSHQRSKGSPVILLCNSWDLQFNVCLNNSLPVLSVYFHRTFYLRAGYLKRICHSCYNFTFLEEHPIKKSVLRMDFTFQGKNARILHFWRTMNCATQSRRVC